MKKLIFSTVFMAFAVAAQAGDAKSASKCSESDCCSKMEQTKTSTSTCPYAKTGGKGMAKQVLMSPKAKSLV